MLINFSVENFRSFGEEQTLNLVSSKAHKEHLGHCVDLAGMGQSVLRTALLYGANAAGKSNLVKAIGFARELILRGVSPSKQISVAPFRFADTTTKPTSMEFRFLADEQIFVYGFSVTAEEIGEEWLVATTEKGRDRDVFHRKREQITIGNLNTFGGDWRVSENSLKALKQLGTRKNQLLLNKIVDLNDERKGGLLRRASWWFSDCLTVIEPHAHFVPIVKLLDEHEDFRKFVAEFLGNVGTGIDDLTIEQSEIEADKLPKPLVEELQEPEDSERILFAFGAGMSLQLKEGDPSTIIRRNLEAKHKVEGRDYPLSFEEESDGTQRFLHLLPSLYHLKNRSSVFVIDELDRSLHPLLTRAFVQFFVDSCENSCQQLIVTTHDTHLLDLSLLRRDEIWFAEKDEKQQTHLYSLADMKVRKDLRIERGYLHGRFGAIPMIRGVDRLKELVECMPVE